MNSRWCGSDLERGRARVRVFWGLGLLLLASCAAAPGLDVAPSFDYYSEAMAAPDDAEWETEPQTVQSWRRMTEATQFASVSLGGGDELELLRMDVHVHVEGFRARTVVDHVFYNPYGETLEGTFRYNLPPESSVSYYSMFLGQGGFEPTFYGPWWDGEMPDDVAYLSARDPGELAANADPYIWGELREGRIVAKARGREVFEQISRQQVDPALVEEVGPNMFEARVFPIAAGGYHRVIVAYEQALPEVDGELEYLFPLPEGDVPHVGFALVAPASYSSDMQYTGDPSGVIEQSTSEALIFEGKWDDHSPGGQLAFRMQPADASPSGQVVTGIDPSQQDAYFVARLNPLAQQPTWPTRASAERAIFLLDTSLSESPDRFNLDLALIEGILAAAPEIAAFNVVTFDAGARWYADDWIANDAAGRAQVLAGLQDVVLEGATNLEAALRALANPPSSMSANQQAGENQSLSAVDIHLLTDGGVTIGADDAAQLGHGFRQMMDDRSGDGSGDRSADRPATRVFAYRTGLGAENLEIFRALTQGGGVFNCFTEAALADCATAHQLQGFVLSGVEVVGRGHEGALVEDVLIAGRGATLFPGTELTVAGRVVRPGPATIRLLGEVNGQTVVIDEIAVELRPSGTLAPRAWAEIAVSQLLSTRDEGLEELAMALSQHFRIANRMAAFLVLETDQEYDLYELTEVHSNLEGAPIDQLIADAPAFSPRPRSLSDRVLDVLGDDYGGRLSESGVLDSWVYEELTSRLVAGVQPRLFSVDIPLVRRGAVSASYLTASANADGSDDLEIRMFENEALRRQPSMGTGAAVRALTSIIEHHPRDAEIARAVGWQLMSWGADDLAADLFADVLELRPYEPQSYRDLANVIWTAQPALSALLFEAAYTVANNWGWRFGPLQVVIGEEYALLARDVLRTRPDSRVASLLQQRIGEMGLRAPAGDLRVTLSWNTDNTDIDLWVTDPDGERCYYGEPTTSNGGQLLSDVTVGFGPERFEAIAAIEGDYTVTAHFYGETSNVLRPETYVNVTVWTELGTQNESVHRYTLRLDEPGDEAQVAVLRL